MPEVATSTISFKFGTSGTDVQKTRVPNSTVPLRKRENNMKLVKQSVTLVAVVIAAIFSTSGCERDKVAKKENSQPATYVDPKGYFKILPPVDWSIQEYRDDIRSKVAFIASGDRIELRVLVQTVNISDYGRLVKKLKDVQAKLAVPMNIEPIVFNDLPAIKRAAVITVQGFTQRFVWVDLLVGGALHNLQYGAPVNVFDKYYDNAWQSMLTYEPLKQQKQGLPEEVRKHNAASWIRLARIALEMKNTQAARDAVSSGLEVDPENAELSQLKLELDKH